MAITVSTMKGCWLNLDMANTIQTTARNITKNINKKVNDLHKSAVKYVNAKAQATIIHNIEDQLTEDELRIYKRGRNQKSHTSPKNADIIDYKHATGFEALIGYLYLDKNYERLEYIISEGIKIIEANM